MSRSEICRNIFGSNALFIAGLAVMPALLFNPGTESRVVQFLFFLFLAWLCGKRINVFLTIFVFAGIVAFNLLIPYGRIIFSVGNFNITEGALRAGVHRAVTFQALVMISRITIREDLKIPGKFGQLLGESLRIFSVMMSRKMRIKGINIIAEIDNMLLELSEEEEVLAQVTEKQKTSKAGLVLLFLFIVLSWVPFGMYYLLK